LRVLIRQRDTHLRGAARQVQHMQKALKQMNLQLSKVLTDITGVTGLSIIEAIVAGERDPAVLARYRDPRVKASAATIRKALTGHYLSEHLFTLQQALSLYRFYQDFNRRVGRPDRATLASPGRARHRRTAAAAAFLQSQSRTPRRQRSALRRARADLPRGRGGPDANRRHRPSVLQGFIAEVGWDMRRWKSAKHFASWLGVCPYNKITGGRVLASGTKRTTGAAKASVTAGGAKPQTQQESFGRTLPAPACPAGRTHGHPGHGAQTGAHPLCNAQPRAKLRPPKVGTTTGAAAPSRGAHRAVRHLKKRAAALGFQLVPAAITFDIVSE
jgi:hypothetical protein